MTAVSLEAQIVGPALTQKVDPPVADDRTNYLIEPAQVSMTVDENGSVAALSSTGSLADSVVQALSKWRFTPGTKNGKPAAFAIALNVPLRRTPAEYLLRAGMIYPPPRGKDPAKAAADRTPEKAANLEAKLKDGPESADTRAELLTFAASRTDAESAAMRDRQVSWLVSNQPENHILGTPAARIPASSAAYAAVRSLWLKQVAAQPKNQAVLCYAVNFLQGSDPGKAEELLVPATSIVGGAAVWLGRDYGTAALGMNGISAVYADHARSMLAATQDQRVLLAALSAVTESGKEMSKSGTLPASYQPLCQDLLVRVKAFYPETKESCEVRPPTNGANTVTSANLITKITPVYPIEAKGRRIAGSVRFAAMIARDGSIKDLELLNGPLVFYSASREAVLQWKYKPTLFNGVPVEVSTQIDVNFQMH